MKKFLEQKKSAIVSGMSNNKGFSLVELIIVVAIMAVLMGVLAPQYLRFVETSRIQADQTAFNEVMKVMTIATASLKEMPKGTSVTWGLDGKLSVANEVTGTQMEDELKLTLGDSLDIGKPSSTCYSDTWTSHVLTVGVDNSGVPFIWTSSDAWSYVLGIPTADDGTGQVMDDPF